MRTFVTAMAISAVSALLLPGAAAWAKEVPPAEREPAPDTILARPEAVNPFAYAKLVGWLWAEGRRQQAAFWFYIFQERSRPWADADTMGDGAAALRAALSDELGTLVNAWVASDVVAWRSIVDRALSYEAHLPLSGERPDGVTAADWQARVAQARKEYVAAAKQTLFTLDPKEFAEQRRSSGLYVGPLQDPGPALPETWR